MKIFLLDDDASFKDDLKEMAKSLLEQDSNLYSECKSLRDTRDFLFGEGELGGRQNEFDIFFIDYYLEKGESGIDIIKELREKTDKPIVLLSNHDDAKIAFEAGVLGATMFSVKDELISSSHLKKIIAEAIAKENSKHKK